MLNYVEQGLIHSLCSRLETTEEQGDLEAKCKCCHLANLEGEEYSPLVHVCHLTGQPGLVLACGCFLLGVSSDTDTSVFQSHQHTDQLRESSNAFAGARTIEHLGF